jgi:hypothetical protein
MCYAGPLATHTSYIVPFANERACTILAEFNRAQTELIGKAVILTDGKAGTVNEIWLDEFHGTANFHRRSPGHVADLDNKTRTEGMKTPFPAPCLVILTADEENVSMCAPWDEKSLQRPTRSRSSRGENKEDISSAA